MTTDFERIRQIFLAISEQPPARWEALLDDACSNDPELRHQVAQLLNAHAGAEAILDRDPPRRARWCECEGRGGGAAAVGGRYTLIEWLGAGGMGTVWMAQQTDPVRRLVALKLIKAGMDSKQIIARFEAERQALALMDN